MVTMPKFVMRINSKPLFKGMMGSAAQVSSLAKVRKKLLTEVKREIQKSNLSVRAKKALSDSLKVVQTKNSITVTTSHPAFKSLIEGRQPKQMKWLTKATRPIPIITKQGELIFRTATKKSMSNGRWMHPGHRPTKILDKAREATRASAQKKILKDIKKMLLGKR